MAKGTKILNSAIAVDDNRNVILRVNVAGEGTPADEDIDGGEGYFYIDLSGPDPILRFKVNADGSMISGDVATLTA
jgi:hypothetical protein